MNCYRYPLNLLKPVLSYLVFFFMILLVTLLTGGCLPGKKEEQILPQLTRDLIEYQKVNIPSYYDLKKLKDDGTLEATVDQMLGQLQSAAVIRSRMVGYAGEISDTQLHNLLQSYLELAEKRERLIAKHLSDLKQDLNLKNKNPDATVDIDSYLARLSPQLLEIEQQSNESLNRLQVLLNAKKKK